MGFLTNFSWLRINASANEKGLPEFGLYHFALEESHGRARVHLRIERGDDKRPSHGTLLVNANQVVQLNYTAAIMAYFALSKMPKEVVIRTLTRHFNVSPSAASKDYEKFLENIIPLVKPDGPCPVCELDLDLSPPFSLRPSLPYRMDIAITYRCNNDCVHCYNARTRNFPELSTEEWVKILDRLWKIGIPHIVFTGGEPTLRNDLPELIAYAQNIGFITGLNTNGRRLSDKHFVEQLVHAGLDHVQITLESHNPDIHDKIVAAQGAWQQTVKGITYALDTPLFVMTNTTLLRDNAPYLGNTLDFLAKLGVPTVGLNGLIYSGRGADCDRGLCESELPALLELAKHRTTENNQRLIWYTPTQYCAFDPMSLELGVKGCTAALYNMCIEPDGSVLPCQSYYQSLGNILTDSWESIWNHDLCLYIREHHYIDERCKSCVLLKECGGGCPLFKHSEFTSPNSSLNR